MRLIGVAVTTSRPNTMRRNSRTPVSQGVMSRLSGPEAANPTSPPAFWTFSIPSAGQGMPWLMWIRPRSPVSSAAEPMTIRPLSVGRSAGVRMSRHANGRHSRGMTGEKVPTAPTTTVRVRSSSGPSLSHHTAAAMRRPTASRIMPNPSRRRSGSRSRALRPAARTRNPTVCASSRHTSSSARPSHTNSSAIGPSEAVCGRGLRFAVGRRGRDCAEVGRRAGDFLPVPPPERWEDLGARVAMPSSLLRVAERFQAPAGCVAVGACAVRSR